MENTTSTHSVAFGFELLQKTLGNTHHRILSLLKQQPLTHVSPLYDGVMGSYGVHGILPNNTIIKFIFPWKEQEDKNAVCRKGRLFVDINQPINPFLLHCFTNYQRFEPLQWLDMENNDLIELGVFEEGFLFTFYRLTRREISQLYKGAMSADKELTPRKGSFL